LQEQLKNLMSTNARLGDEAAQLARALTGQAKTRGDWGEQILEQLLQHAGLRRGHEYRTQVTGTTAEGDRLQPDIVVDLPDKKHVIIDSKLSLIPWIAVSEAPHDEARHSALKALHVAVREHLKQLSLKNYEHLFDLVSVDFVLMFIPIEGAFAEVVGTDPTIYQEALDKNVVIVSPTTLLATLRTIAAIWRYDRQEQHAFKIAEAAGKMYDQFVLYTEVLNKVGERLDQAQDAFEQARSRLSDGRGNLIRRAQIVKELGAKAAKRFDQSVTALAGDDFVALLGENDALPDADTDADSNANNAGMNDAHPV
jgi:DNA recombination protein RmuC